MNEKVEHFPTILKTRRYNTKKLHDVWSHPLTRWIIVTWRNCDKSVPIWQSAKPVTNHGQPYSIYPEFYLSIFLSLYSFFLRHRSSEPQTYRKFKWKNWDKIKFCPFVKIFHWFNWSWIPFFLWTLKILITITSIFLSKNFIYKPLVI